MDVVIGSSMFYFASTSESESESASEASLESEELPFLFLTLGMAVPSSSSSSSSGIVASSNGKTQGRAPIWQCLDLIWTCFEHNGRGFCSGLKSLDAIFYNVMFLARPQTYQVMPEIRSTHPWTRSDPRLVKINVKPNHKPCDDNDITIFGSGIMTTGDSSGLCVDANFDQSSSVAENVGGIPVYLSAIQEWMIKFGYSFVTISVRTDISWYASISIYYQECLSLPFCTLYLLSVYRLGRPSKQYAAWYKPVLKTVRLAIALITMLNNQSRASRLSFADVIKKVSKFSKTNPAYISSNPTEVERYVVVHGHIILQQFAELPNKRISKCAFVSGKTPHQVFGEEKVVLKKEINSNLRASKNKVMQATTTRLIKRIWEEFYSNYLPEDTKEAYIHEVKVDEELDEEHGENSEEYPEDIKVEQMQVDENMEKFCFSAKSVKPPCSSKATKWDGELIRKTCFGESLYKRAIVCGNVLIRKTCFGESLYKRAIVCGNVVNIGGCVLVETADSDHLPSIYFVEFMFEKSDSRKMMLMRFFLTNDCLEIELEDVKEVVAVEILLIPWGHQHRKSNACKDKIVRERAEDQRIDQFPLEYYCKSLYWPERGAFFKLPKDTMGLGTGVCHSCKIEETEREKDVFKVNLNRNGFTLKGTEFHLIIILLIKIGTEIHLNIIETHNCPPKACPESTKVKVRRFFRPEDISEEKAYYSDIREIPKQPGSDWRVLPSEKVRLSNGQVVDLIPWCLPITAEKHNQWKGLFGRLDWEGNFPTSVTDPHPMGMVGTCFHPDQDRIITVRECARSQGFSDSYKFVGDIQHKHRQIGNAVPPPLAFAPGRKLKEAVEMKASTSQRYSCVL
ncbi:hypothetical protein CUMW_270820 [Citrus unshiu]|uniref:DNA (cytosine-5-)-methyltransferase n=1 Tax=Citrus unshiu TaxID=55188 RepID=A0A2H5QXE4_CITUN|nr:hypothetical protein CUMW_270820 [Citrus unshiu]